MTNLQSQRHNRGLTTLRQDSSSISSKQKACGFSSGTRCQYYRYFFQKLQLLEVTAKPTVLRCLGCTWYHTAHIKLLMLTPQRFPQHYYTAHLSSLIDTTQTTPGPSQNTDYVTKGAELLLAMNALCQIRKLRYLLILLANSRFNVR